MAQIHELPEVPVLVLGIFCGSSKPDNVEDYLRQLVDDLNRVMDQGVTINKTKIGIDLRVIIADSPARAFIKGVANFNAANGCIKCKIVGKKDKKTHRMVFEGTAEPRTNKEFRQGDYEISHQKRPTPLLDIKDKDIIKILSIADDLHLLHLGIAKKLGKGYAEGSLAPFPKWNEEDREEISKILAKTKLPAEINRAMRPLKYLAYWKGSEYRTFLNHISIALLRGRIHDDAYHHFKLFYVAITLFSSNHFKNHWDYAEALLKQFVEDFGLIYGKSHITSNVHNLLHIAEDVREFGPLPTISSYPFESRLNFLKRLVRTGHRTLEQIVCRLTELNELEASESKEKMVYPIIKHKKDEVKLYITDKFQLRKGDRNGWFLTKDNKLIRYSSVKQVPGSYIIEGHQLAETQPAFSYPNRSEVIYNYIGRVSDIPTDVVKVDLNNVKVKLVAVSVDDGESFYFSPLMHTLLE
uniref:uncharacterized protein LOC120952913 n=1 Tax=Anopheles coluzzii TaxID=1518534 RepID=UPI0020FFB416|nr:uncharacterized protein LOC120952913 [Anopheles coluzzii]